MAICPQTMPILSAKTASRLISRHLTFETTHFYPNHPKLTLSEKLVGLLKQCVSTKTLQQIHTQMLLNSIDKPNFLLSKLIDLKNLNYASLLFSHIPVPNDYAFNIMIRGLTTTWQKYDLSLRFYYKMKSSGLRPNNFTYPFLFIACANLLAVDHGRVAHSMVFRNGFSVDGHMGFAGDAVALFETMRDEGFEPNEMTVVSVLGACGDLGDLSLGRWVEGFAVDSEMELNSYVGSALIVINNGITSSKEKGGLVNFLDSMWNLGIKRPH
ncbi:hypothetical protein U1Q18_046770 [Sarracenia purpurea var. burkii]